MDKKQALIGMATKPTLLEVGNKLGLDVKARDRVASIREAFMQSQRASFEVIVGLLVVDDLKWLCRWLELPDAGLKAGLVARLNDASLERWCKPYERKVEEVNDVEEAPDARAKGRSTATAESKGSWGGGPPPPASHATGEAANQGAKHSNGNTPPRTSQVASAILHRKEDAVLTLTGLSWPVSLDQVRSARKTLAVLLHPDKHNGDARAQEPMRIVNEGCDLLERRLGAR